MEQKDDEPPPFWLQTTTTFRQVDRHRRRHRHTSSLFFNTGVLITFLLVTAILFLVIVIPYILSLARQVFNPNLFKSSWNSLNIVLVLFAIICGFLSKKDDDQNTPANTPTSKNTDKSEHNTSQWYAYNDRSDNVPRLRRSSNSYPDLRQESTLVFKENKWRFYDDTDVENYQFQRSDSQLSLTQTRSFRTTDENENDNQEVLDESENVSEDVTDIEVRAYRTDRVQVRSSESVSPSPSVIDEDESGPDSASEAEEIVQGGSDNFVDEDESSSKNDEVGVDEPEVVVSVPEQTSETLVPPSSPPSPASYSWPSPLSSLPPTSIPAKETNQTFETIGYGRYKWTNSPVVEPIRSEVQLPPPSPSPPRSQPCKHENSGRKRGGVTVTKDFFTSFYHQSKRKRKHKRRSYDTLEEFIEPSSETSIHRSKSTPEFPPLSPPPPTPPPPPPLPSHSVFHTLFSKKGSKTRKKVHSVSTNSTPPPRGKASNEQGVTSATPNSKRTREELKFPTSKYEERNLIGGYSAFGDESKIQTPPLPPPLPKKPVKKTISFSRVNSDEKAVNSGTESPLRPIPPPPPPPPFKMKPWRFAIQGDYAKIESNNNSPRSGYSASEDESISPSSAKNSQIPSSPLFCPSPDVNMKADDFIAKFRAKLTLEKSDSINLKQGTVHSRLRPDSI